MGKRAMMFNEPEVRKRIAAVHARMQQRAKPRLWKSGKRSGSVRVPGIDRLPFRAADLYGFALGKVGEGAIRCPYCVAIGRNARVIDMISVVFDHIVPLARGGSHSLSNLECVCADCNNLKGSLSLDCFIQLIRTIEAMADTQDRDYLYKCLRTHGQALQMQRGSFGKKKSNSPEVPQPPKQLALADDKF